MAVIADTQTQTTRLQDHPDWCEPTIPARAGFGLRHRHFTELFALKEDKPEAWQQLKNTIWFEVHTENYFGDGGLPRRFLEKVRADFPLSLHGVGLSLGSAEGMDRDHLEKVAAVVEAYAPGLVSEHLSFSKAKGHFLNDLLPVPYHPASLELFCRHIDQTQDRLKRQILIENPSTLLGYKESSMREADFLAALVERTGCGILLDINNIYVSAHNLGDAPLDYFEGFPFAAVQEFHLAGHRQEVSEAGSLLIDDHGSQVSDPVWQLFDQSLGFFDRAIPCLIEWDTDVPCLQTLSDQAALAQQHLDAAFARDGADPKRECA